MCRNTHMHMGRFNCMNMPAHFNFPRITLKRALLVGGGLWFLFWGLTVSRFCFSEVRFISELNLCRRAHPDRDIQYITRSEKFRKDYPNGPKSSYLVPTCRIDPDVFRHDWLRTKFYLFGRQVYSARLDVPFRVNKIDGCGFQVDIGSAKRLDNDGNRYLKKWLARKSETIF